MAMPIHLDEDRPRIHLVVSPVTELLGSLHVLADPTHHPSNQRWAEETMAAMSPDLRAEVAYFGRHFNQWMEIADLPHFVPDAQGAPLTLDAFLAGVATLPAGRVVEVAVGPTPPEVGLDPETAAVREEARRHPERFVRRLLSLLDRYWKEVFAPEWERRRPVLEQRRRHEAVRLESMTPEAWLTGLHDRISYDRGAGELVFHKRVDYRFPLDRLREIICIPSTFSAPHLWIGFDADRLWIYINTPVPAAEVERVPSAILSVAKALSDETRVLIYKAVLKRPCYTQELARHLGLAEPTVSRHLKVLKEAGLVRSEKEGPLVLYTGVLGPVDQLPARLREFLRG
jgi:DNA-binding transcriptional ArsR family regulator